MAISAALFHRERTGKGQHVQTSLLQAGLALQGTRIGKLPAIDAQTTDSALDRMREVQEAGGSYRELVAARGNLFDQMGRAIGVEDDPTADPEFDSLPAENRNLVDEMLERIRGIMMTRTMDEWIEIFDREGAPISKVNWPEDLANDPQVKAMGYMIELERREANLLGGAAGGSRPAATSSPACRSPARKPAAGLEPGVAGRGTRPLTGPAA